MTMSKEVGRGCVDGGADGRRKSGLVGRIGQIGLQGLIRRCGLFAAWALAVSGVSSLGGIAQARASDTTEWPQVDRRIGEDMALLSADGSRTWVPAGRYDRIEPAGRVALVRRNQAWGLIDADGRALTALRYQQIEPFGDPDAPQGFIVAGERWRRGLLDAEGRVITDAIWQQIRPVKITPEGGAQARWFFGVQQGHREGVLDASGRAVLPVQFAAVSWLGERSPMVVVTQGALQGVCNVLTGECPLPLSSKRYEPFEHGPRDAGLVKVTWAGRVGVLDALLREVLPPWYDAIEALNGRSQGALHVRARQGLHGAQFVLQPDESGRWAASQPKQPLPVAARRDDHPQALRQGAVIDARYVPQALSDAASVEQAFEAKGLRELRQPSIQLSGATAYVGFDLFAPGQGDATRPLPDVWARCVAPAGVRLVAWHGAPRELAKACASPSLPSVHLQPTSDADGSWLCSGCEALGLPQRWLRRDEPPVDASCAVSSAPWSPDAARRDYARWLSGWLPTWQPALQGFKPSPASSADWLRYQANPSRALSTLAAVMRRPDALLGDLGIDAKQVRRFDLGAALIKWIQKAEPVGSGGLYPEPEVEFASQCAQVWYLRWPELDQRMRGRARVAGQPFDLGWGLPPAGTLARHTTPFLTFSRGEDGGLRLSGISREFLQALWLLEGGR